MTSQYGNVGPLRNTALSSISNSGFYHFWRFSIFGEKIFKDFPRGALSSSRRYTTKKQQSIHYPTYIWAILVGFNDFLKCSFL